MNATQRKHLQHAEDLVFFEQWLRFYFIAEENGKLYIRMPASELAKARALHPQLAVVADALNNREIDHQTTIAALHQIIISGPCALSGAEWSEILAGRDFRLSVHLLSCWVQAEEDAPDAAIPAFDEWKNRFELWRASPGIKDYAARFLRGDDAPTGRVQ